MGSVLWSTVLHAALHSIQLLQPLHSAHSLSCHISIGAGAAGPTQMRLSFLANNTLQIVTHTLNYLSSQPCCHCWTEMGACAHSLGCQTSIGVGMAGRTQMRLSC